MGLSAQLRLAYRSESEKLQNPANQVNPLYLIKTAILKIAAILETIIKN
jgi:hypothetical protein